MPGIRTSQGRYLEVLQPGALVNLPIEIDVYDGGNPATMLATMEAAFDGSMQVELSEVGSGRFSILRSDAKATAAILARGNLVKFKTGGVYRGSWWVEEPTEVLTSTAEASGEVHTVQGRGALAYLERAVVYPPVWPTQPGAFRSATHGYNGASGTTFINGSRPTGTTNGDLLIAAVAFVGGSSKAITPPPGWREFRRVNNGTTLGVALFAKQASSSEPATWKWPFTTVTIASINVICLQNLSIDYTTYAYTSATQGSGTAIKHPSLSIPTVDGIALTFAAANAGTGMTAPVGYTEATDDAQGSARLQSSYVSPVLGDTGDVLTTNSASGAWVGIHLFIPNSASNDATFSGETPGAILATLIDRAVARGALVDMTYDFTGTADSQGQPWPDTFDLSFHVGTSLLDVWRHLVSLGMEGEMSHDLRLSAYVDRSRDRTADVIFRKGYHFLGNVTNSPHYAGLRTRFLVEGAGGRVIEVGPSSDEADPKVGRREGFLSMGTSDTATDLARAGTQAITQTQLQDSARSIPVDHGLLTDGRYEPWEDYRPGDYVGMDPDGTGITTAERVVAITIAQRDVLDYTVTLDLNSVTLEALVRMKRQMDAITGSGSASIGGAGASLGLGSTASGGGGSSGVVSAQSGDTPGFLYDKVDVSAKLVKSLGGVVGNRTVALDLGAIALDDLSDVSAASPSAGNSLIYNGALWVPGTAGGIQDRIWLPASGALALSDEFEDGALDAAWTRVDAAGASGHLTWTEAAGVLSAAHLTGTDTAAHQHALVKSLGGATFPKTIQCGVRWWAQHAVNYQMLGIVLANGATHGAGAQIVFMPFLNTTGGTISISLRPYINYTTDGQGPGNLNPGNWPYAGGHVVHLRLVWSASNTFDCYTSPNGVDWQSHGSRTYTLSPTHVGLIYSNWGTATPGIGTYEYFRVY